MTTLTAHCGSDALQASLGAMRARLGLAQPKAPLPLPSLLAAPQAPEARQATRRPSASHKPPAHASPGIATTYYAENKAAIRAQQARYRANNREAILARRREAAAANRAAQAASNAKHYAANREAILAQKRAAYAAKKAARGLPPSIPEERTPRGDNPTAAARGPAHPAPLCCPVAALTVPAFPPTQATA